MFEICVLSLAMSTLTLVFICISVFLWYLRRNDDYWKRRGVKYQPRRNLFTILRLFSSMTFATYIRENYNKYGRLYGSFQFSQPVLTIGDPKYLRNILVKDFSYFSQRQNQSFKNKVLDKMVTVLKGEDWKRIRTIMTPAFTSRQMRKMEHIINSCAATVLKTFEKHYQNGEPVECKSLFGAFVTDVIALAAFATKVDSINNPDHIFVKMIKESNQAFNIFRIILLSLVPQFLLNLFRLEELKSIDFFKRIVLDVIQERREKGQRYDDFLQSLMDAVEEQKPEKRERMLEEKDETDQYGCVTNSEVPKQLKYNWLSEDELVAQCVLFYIVGHETTASTLAYVAHVLALNQQWQDKLIFEIDEAYEKHGKLGNDAIREMKIMDAVVSETLRMYPPALTLSRRLSQIRDSIKPHQSGSGRVATADYKLGDTEIVVTKGMNILIPLYAMHYDAEYFPDPEIFKPERFMDSSPQRHPQYAYLPFGEGPRNCLGMRFALMEIKLCMANILHHYRIKTHSTTKVPLEYRKFTPFLSVKELPLGLEKRH